MKARLILIIAAVALLPLSWAGAQTTYQPPDSCLKMYCDNDWDVLTQKGSSNPDSVRVDSCDNSPTYGELYAKKYFLIQLKPYYYPFDKVLKPDTVKQVSEISSNKQQLKQRFEELELEFGKIYFTGLFTEFSDSSLIANPLLLIYFDKIQDCNLIEETFSTTIDSVNFVKYRMRALILLDVEDNDILVNNTAYLYPNPVIDNLFIKFPMQENKIKIQIFSIIGIKLKEVEFNECIDLSDLPNGFYYLLYKNNIYKFMKINE